ncbi:hepatocyte growth factor-like [Haliotis rufescens]|uniref:hepatocyte growth factor-like n=1 Tax=Haliotis rufescens TaxID=6454 RepID=UPI00201EAC12|nr:hepatocyte growth factor-like [Haliotis rufescens]
MAACNVCVICFWVLMAENAVGAFETKAAPRFLPSKYFTSLIKGKPSQQEKMEKRVQDIEKTIGSLFYLNENKERRLGYLETTIANLTSKFDVDCGSPTPCDDTDVVYSSTGLYAVANYKCKKGLLNITPEQEVMSFCETDGSWTKVKMKCANISSCWWISQRQAAYTGTQSTTSSGKICQRWDSQEPHTHEYTDDDKFVISGFDAPQNVTGSANYCRDPSRDGYLWCYTTDSDDRWETCEVPLCNP